MRVYTEGAKFINIQKRSKTLAEWHWNAIKVILGWRQDLNISGHTFRNSSGLFSDYVPGDSPQDCQGTRCGGQIIGETAEERALVPPAGRSSFTCFPAELPRKPFYPFLSSLEREVIREGQEMSLSSLEKEVIKKKKKRPCDIGLCGRDL